MNRNRLIILALAGIATLIALAPAAASAQGDCPQGFQCRTVTVPLDRTGAVPGTIDLPVAVEEGEGPLMLALGGGPGQGMVARAQDFGGLLASLTGHRIAVVDQRGTGAVALQCKGLQDAALTDFSTPPPGESEACGEQLGAERAFYSTTDTVEDIEAIRQALGEQQIAVLGVSYGTYVAERYARAYPGNVSSIVLDSVVPQENVDPLFVANMKRTSGILEELCKPRSSRCAKATKDPVGDLRKLVTRTNEDPLEGTFKAGGEKLPLQVDGAGLFDLVSGLSSFFQTEFPKFPGAVKAALRGKPNKIVKMYGHYRQANYTPDPADQSWGLHSATLCADVAFPWGSPSTDPATRGPAVEAALADLPAKAFGPFDRATPAAGGVIQTCQAWQPTTVAPPPEPGPLPDVPTLIAAGTWDLSTPLADAKIEAARTPTADFVKLPEAGHSALTSLTCAQKLLASFYAQKKLGNPCKDNKAPRN